MNNKLFLEEVKYKAKQEAKNNIRKWVKWGFFVFFLFLSIASFMSIIAISAFRQTVSLDNFDEMEKVGNAFLQNGQGENIGSSIKESIPYYDFLNFAIKNNEILGLIAIILSVLFLILSFLFLRIKTKKIN